MKIILVSLVIAVVYGLAPSVVLYAGGDHVAEAITHAQTAVLQGQQGYPDDFIKHAQEAVDHAEMAKQTIDSPHLEKGIKALKFAVNDAKNGYVDDAVKTVQSAIEHLTEVPASK